MRPLLRVDSVPPTHRDRSDLSGQRGVSAHSVQDVTCERSLRSVIWSDGRLGPETVAALRENPDVLLSGGEMLKDGDRCTVVKVMPPGATKTLVLKRYNAKGSLHTATHVMLRSRARWCWINGRKLLEAGLLTPRPLAFHEERYAGAFRLRSFLLSEFVPGISLRDVIEQDQADQEDLRSFAKQFAFIWQTLGQMRIGHGDMKATNFIVDSNKRLWMIDLDGMRVHRSRLLLRRERRNDLARFMRNWQALPEVAAIFRARIGTG